jgi:hypothetical protein
MHNQPRRQCDTSTWEYRSSDPTRKQIKVDYIFARGGACTGDVRHYQMGRAHRVLAGVEVDSASDHGPLITEWHLSMPAAEVECVTAEIGEAAAGVGGAAGVEGVAAGV